MNSEPENTATASAPVSAPVAVQPSPAAAPASAPITATTETKPLKPAKFGKKKAKFTAPITK